MSNLPVPLAVNKKTACQMLSISMGKLDALMAAKKIRYVKLGPKKKSGVRFYVQDLIDFLRSPPIDGHEMK